MKKIYLSFLLSFLSFISYEQAVTCISIKGDTAGGVFEQLILSSEFDYFADSTQREVLCFAWTDDAHGFPIYNTRGLIKYDISFIPSNSVIISAKLNLYANTNSINGINGSPTYGAQNTSLLQKVIESWTVSGTGWLNQPTATNTNQKTLPQSINTAENYVVDVTDFVQDWVSHPETNYGMLLRLATEQYYNSMIFNSGQAPDSLKPALEICYTHADTCIAIKGDTASALFEQLILSSEVDYSADSTQREVLCFAWTDDAHGFPIYNTRGLIKYDISSIPSNSVVIGAKLNLYANTNSINGVNGSPTYGSQNTSFLQKVIEPWTVSSTGWLNQPAAANTNQKTLPQSTNTAENYVVDVTDFVQDWVNHPETNYGMLLRLETEQYYNSMIFNSGQAPDSLKPRLEICYNMGSLPAVLKNFQGSVSNYTANLTWLILDGISLSSIVVERSFNGNTFNSINNIVVKSISTESKYHIADNDLSPAIAKVYYRLKLVDKAGKYQYSNILILSLLQSNPVGLQILPNPVRDKIQLNVQAVNSGSADILIINAFGQTVRKYKYQVEKGNNSINLGSVSNLKKGLYMVYLSIDTQLVIKKFIKE